MYGGISGFNIIFIIILIISAITRQDFNWQVTLLMMPGLVLAITLHEYAHAKTSDRLGDPTPSEQGRLTLNPLSHMDVAGTAFLLFAGFGWGKPVQINPRYYRNPARDNMLVALAGPVTNFILSFILFILTIIMEIFAPVNQITKLLYNMIYLGGYISLSLGIFNLLPLPPLDGSKILRYFLKGKAREVMYNIEQYSTIILLLLFITDIPRLIISPIINWIAFGMKWIIVFVLKIFGL